MPVLAGGCFIQNISHQSGSGLSCRWRVTPVLHKQIIRQVKNEHDRFAGLLFRSVDRERTGAMGKRRGLAAVASCTRALPISFGGIGPSSQRGTDGGQMRPILGRPRSDSAAVGTRGQDRNFLERTFRALFVETDGTGVYQLRSRYSAVLCHNHPCRSRPATVRALHRRRRLRPCAALRSPHSGSPTRHPAISLPWRLVPCHKSRANANAPTS